jgi:outer membrane protein OmpA-like peptidoglycan-associated protein
MARYSRIEGMERERAAAALALVAVVGMGCESWNRTKKGAVIGAAGGGAAGAVIGHATGSTVRGAIIGAAVGGAAGALIGRHMDKQAEKMAREIPDAKVSRVGEGIAVSFESGILFPFDSAALQEGGRTNLRKLADSLKENARTDVMIVGHADSIGRAGYNQELSERRARAAVDYLGGQGVPRSRLIASGKGETDPVASNETEEGRRQNRRVEVAIYANKEWREEAKREAGGS